MAIVLLGIIIFLLYNNNLNKKFFNKKVDDVIIKRNNWQLRTSEFYLENGLRIDSTYVMPLDLKIGDSISKKSNTGRFDVYRKNNGKYKLYKSYDLKQ